MSDIHTNDVCFITSTLGMGGAERQLYYILKSLKQNNRSAIVICMSQGDYWEKPIRDLGIPVFWAGKDTGRIARLVSIIKIIRQNDIDIIHSQHFHTNLYAIVSGFILKKRVIGSVRNDVFHEIKDAGLYGKVCFNFPKQLVVNSRAAIQNAMQLGKKEEQLFFLPNVIDEKYFVPIDRKKHAKIVVSYVGTLWPPKRVDRILNIAKACKDRNANIEFRIYGDGILSGELQKISEQLGVRNVNVFFYGKTTDPLAAYQASDIFLLTSDYEGTPNVILEGMSCGLPIVSTNVGDVKELINSGVNGFVLEVGDDDGIMESLLQLSSDPQLRVKMGKLNREIIVQTRSVNSLYPRLEELYRS